MKTVLINFNYAILNILGISFVIFIAKFIFKDAYSNEVIYQKLPTKNDRYFKRLNKKLEELKKNKSTNIKFNTK